MLHPVPERERERASAFRKAQQRRRELASLRLSISRATKAILVRGGEEYMYFDDDNFENMTFPLALSFDKFETSATVIINIRFDRVKDYIGNQARLRSELLGILASGMVELVKNIRTEQDLLRSRANNLERIAQNIIETASTYKQDAVNLNDL